MFGTHVVFLNNVMHIIQIILETFAQEWTFKLQLFLLENYHFNEEVQRKSGRKMQISVYW